jgi:hypothetical protein
VRLHFSRAIGCGAASAQFLSSLPNDLQDAVDIARDFVVPEPDHSPTFVLQEIGAYLVLGLSFLMLAAIDLDHETQRYAAEIDYVRTDLVLAPKL